MVHNFEKLYANLRLFLTATAEYRKHIKVAATLLSSTESSSKSKTSFKTGFDTDGLASTPLSSKSATLVGQKFLLLSPSFERLPSLP